MRWLYSALMWLAQPLLRRKLKRRGALEEGYLQAVPERFGHYGFTPLAQGVPTVWVHAVSLGETRTAALLIARLRERLPGMRLVLTHGTATGRAEGASLLQAGDFQAWQPWDTAPAVQRFLEHFKPDIGILMETEIWPNLVALCKKAGVPLVLANARLSERSLRKAQRLSWLARPTFGALQAVWAQTHDDARRLAQLGAPVKGVFGNLKFDAAPDTAQIRQGRAWRAALGRPVAMLASSREGEEASLVDILKDFQAKSTVNKADTAINSGANELQWLIVPRHPQRFDAVASLMEVAGFAVSRRSAWPDAGPGVPQSPGKPTLWLGDSLGEMAQYYAMADVALLGGSFEPMGGQNLIEAAACGCPLIMGPHTFNFAQAAQLAQSAGAALRVPGLPDAVVSASVLTHNSAALALMAKAAVEFSNTHQGALEKTASAVVALLGQQGVDAL